MKAIKILDNVYWVGAIDWNLRNFHGYVTPTGSTYNAYLIIDEKVALIDTVKQGFSSEILGRIKSVISPEKIDYIISNHVEMDHSGSLDVLRKIAPKAKFVANKRAAEDINRYFDPGFEFQVVKTGDVLDLGKRKLSFIEIPMVHWPDSMMAYCPEDSILFPNDMFGQHMATSARFDDGLETSLYEAKKYYANIFMHLTKPVEKALAHVLKFNIKIIAPSHGIIWRKKYSKVIEEYKRWVSGETKDEVVIVYDTMWDSTEIMAKNIADGFISRGVKVHFFNLRVNDPSEIMTAILEAKTVVIGTPTLNNTMLPTVAGFLNYMRGLKPNGKVGFAFGSHGWSGGGALQAESIMKESGIEITRPAIVCKYVPDEGILKQCFEAGMGD